MTAGAYASGAASVGIVVALLATAAWRICRTILPDWTGAPARLAEAAAVLGLFLVTAQMLGAVGLFRRGPLVLCLALVSASVWGFTGHRRVRAGGGGPPIPTSRPPRLATAVAVVMGAVVVSQWTARAMSSFDRGIVDVDSRQYHLPFAAFFAQSGWTTRLHFAWLDPVWSFYPADSELLHATGILAFRHDLLSPVLNLGWLVLALLAGWCIGRPWGVGPASLAGVAVMMATPLMAAEAGSAANDIAALALILTAIALTVTPGPDARLVLAGTAAGLAVGTKVTAIVPIAAFAIAVIVTHRRVRASLLFLVPLVAAGSSWYVRNLVLSGNPLPPAGLGLPRPRFPALEKFGYSVMDYAGDSHFWTTTVPHGLHGTFGAAWPLMLAAALAGAVLLLVRGPQPLVRLLGLVSIVSAVAYTLTPGSAYGAANDPFLFAANLRYLVPALTIALVALPTIEPLRQRQTMVVAAYATVFVITQWSPSSTIRPWPSGYRPGAIVLAIVLVATMTAWVLRRPARRTVLVGAVAAGALLLVGGYRIQRTYLAHRYTGTGAIDAWARQVHNAHIGNTGYAPQYPLTGLDVSNRVEYVGRRVAHGGIATARTCAAWRQLINKSRYDYAVTGTNKWTLEPANEPAWARDDPNAAEILSTPAGTVFALRGPLDPAACPPGT